MKLIGVKSIHICIAIINSNKNEWNQIEIIYLFYIYIYLYIYIYIYIYIYTNEHDILLICCWFVIVMSCYICIKLSICIGKSLSINMRNCILYAYRTIEHARITVYKAYKWYFVHRYAYKSTACGNSYTIIKKNTKHLNIYHVPG